MPTYERTAYRGDETRTVQVRVEVDHGASGGERAYTVVVVADGFEHTATADDAFEALAAVRLQLERDGWLLGVEGSRIDVWPSGMARDQGGGLRAYRVRRGRRPSLDDLVDVFAPAVEHLATVGEQRAAVGSALPTVRWVDELRSGATSGGPSRTLAPVHGLRAVFRRSTPSRAEQWATARSLLGDALSPSEWDEAERLSRRPPGNGRPGPLRLVSGMGADEEGVRWTDLVDVAVDARGVMLVRRFRRKYVGESRMHLDVVLDTRAEGLAHTDFDPLELAATGEQRSVHDLRRWLTDANVVPSAVADLMFWPDHGRVPTDHDDDQGVITVFRATLSGVHWIVSVDAAGHVRVTRERQFLS